jgi:hypothetical protein
MMWWFSIVLLLVMLVETKIQCAGKKDKQIRIRRKKKNETAEIWNLFFFHIESILLPYWYLSLSTFLLDQLKNLLLTLNPYPVLVPRLFQLFYFLPTLWSRVALFVSDLFHAFLSAAALNIQFVQEEWKELGQNSNLNARPQERFLSLKPICLSKRRRHGQRKVKLLKKIL